MHAGGLEQIFGSSWVSCQPTYTWTNKATNQKKKRSRAQYTYFAVFARLGLVNTDDKSPYHRSHRSNIFLSFRPAHPHSPDPASDCCQPSVPHHGGPVRDGTGPSRGETGGRSRLGWWRRLEWGSECSGSETGRQRKLTAGRQRERERERARETEKNTHENATLFSIEMWPVFTRRRETLKERQRSTWHEEEEEKEKKGRPTKLYPTGRRRLLNNSHGRRSGSSVCSVTSPQLTYNSGVSVSGCLSRVDSLVQSVASRHRHRRRRRLRRPLFVCRTGKQFYPRALASSPPPRHVSLYTLVAVQPSCRDDR